MGGEVRECVRCTATTKDGNRCKRRTCKYADMCFQHTELKRGLVVRKSKIRGAGQGLFAAKTFRSDQKITKYGGEVIDGKQFEPSKSTYGVQITNDKVLDGRSTQSGLGRYANDCRAPNKRNRECKGTNARISYNSRTRTASVKVKRGKTIRPGDEVYVAYGRSYWQDIDRARRRAKKQLRRRA